MAGRAGSKPVKPGVELSAKKRECAVISMPQATAARSEASLED
ncbi:hypothetical protein ACFOKK_16070 [Sphingobium fuliginis]